jgi:lipopolysaccharide/colanic/teichoic acid biosynthesis glycosyltransferase
MPSTYAFVKRLFDFTVSLSCLFFFLPLLSVVSIFIRINMGSPILITQERLGFLGRSFCLLKFRSMTFDVNSNHILLPDNQRITRLGAFLRSTSLDELPSLINILNGSMSFVGPRPLPVKYLQRFNDFQLQRMQVKPGLTGLAQINGRNATTWSRRFSYDIEYVRKQSLLLDVTILIKTVFAVVSRKGISNSPSNTMPEFTGDS